MNSNQKTSTVTSASSVASLKRRLHDCDGAEDYVAKPFSLAELRQAKEAFLTSSSGFLLPVTRVDGTPVGEGAVGALTRELRRRLDAEVARQSAA